MEKLFCLTTEILSERAARTAALAVEVVMVTIALEAMAM